MTINRRQFLARTSLAGMGVCVSAVGARRAAAVQADGQTPKSEKADEGPQGFALTIGLNRVDPNHYAGWDGRLYACENDANDMAAIAKSQGFQVTTLLTEEAKRTAVLTEIRNAAKALEPGGIFMISYSGHGGRLPDRNGDEEDGVDETWCLYDAQVIDDELYDCWADFRSGARILVFTDCCHSGTATKENTYQVLAATGLAAGELQERWGPPGGGVKMPENLADWFKTPRDKRSVPLRMPEIRYRRLPLDQARVVFQENTDFYQPLLRDTRREGERKLEATVLLISGCQDSQYSMDGWDNGLFTGNLKRVWNRGKFTGTYAEFHRAIKDQMPATQTPNYYVLPAPNVEFEGQRPFTV